MTGIDGRSLTLDSIGEVAEGRAGALRLTPEARDAIVRARTLIDELAASDAPVYGVNTGFGRLADARISPADLSTLQRNLIRSHAAGVGKPLSKREVRVIMLLRANALAQGHSGCRPEVVERLIEYLNDGLHPIVPEVGSVGASGDLAPLAHVALGLIGEGRVEYRGELRDAADVLSERGTEPLQLQAKEGLALINGTQATTGLGVLSLLRAESIADLADIAGAMTLEGLLGTPEAFRAEVHEVRPHPGQIRVGHRLRALMEDSEIRESHREGDSRVQDAYCLRCMPQVHGAFRETASHVRTVLEREVNSVTDNPLVFPASGDVVSAGNFHAQVVAQALDYLAIALADLASISERRIERLLNPDLSHLPAFLTPNPGLNSGFMIAQVTVADLLSEMRVLAHPASVDSVPTSANQEDHISMGMAAARKLRRSIECIESIFAVELLCAAQALDFLRPLRPGPRVERVFGRIREVVPPLEEDRILSPDIEAVGDLVRSGELNTLAEVE